MEYFLVKMKNLGFVPYTKAFLFDRKSKTTRKICFDYQFEHKLLVPVCHALFACSNAAAMFPFALSVFAILERAWIPKDEQEVVTNFIP